MKKIGKCMFAAVLAAALLFAMPGMTVYAEGEDGQGEYISESVTAQAEDAAAGQPETEQSEVNETDAAAPETGADDAKEAAGAAEDAVPERQEADENDAAAPETGADDAKEVAGVAENTAPERQEADENVVAAPETGAGDAAEPETDFEEITEKEPDDSTQIEALIAALPGAVTEDNAAEVRAQLDEILALYSGLTVEEQEQLDLTRCYALQAALDAGSAPEPAADLPAITNLVVLGEQIKTDESTSGAGWSFDPGTNTLTLENLTVRPEDYPEDIENFLNRAGNNNSVQLTIHLKGNNTIYGMGINTQVFNLKNTTVYLTGDDGAALTIEGGWIQNHFEISGKIEFTVNENRPFQVDNGLIIDNGAKVTVNYVPDCDSSGPTGMFLVSAGGISVKNGSTLEVNTRSTDYSREKDTVGVYCIYGAGPFIVEDSTLILRNDDPNGRAMRALNPLGAYFGYANDYATITNSTVELDSRTGIQTYQYITITGSTVNATENTGYALASEHGEVGIDETSAVNGTAVSHVSETGTPINYIVYGEANLPRGITVAAGNILTVPEGASLTISAGVTLTNNGTMRIHEKASLTGAGTVAGDGTFLIETVTEDLISGTEGLVYNGKDQTDKIQLETTVTLCGKQFTVDTNAANGWTMSISPAEVKAAGNYTVTLEKAGAADITKTFTVAECPHTGLSNRPLGNGKHGGTCPDCGGNVSEDHVWEDGVCSVCDGKAR